VDETKDKVDDSECSSNPIECTHSHIQKEDKSKRREYVSFNSVFYFVTLVQAEDGDENWDAEDENPQSSTLKFELPPRIFKPFSAGFLS
jgi:hypothetical protein